MKVWVLTYFEFGSKGEMIRHREEFPTKISAKINLFFSEKNKRRWMCELKKEEL